MIIIRLPFQINCINSSLTIKYLKMKRLLVVLALGSLVACNSGTSAESKIDSSADAKKDMIDSSTAAKKDALDSSADATKANVDSAAKMASDTLKK